MILFFSWTHPDPSMIRPRVTVESWDLGMCGRGTVLDLIIKMLSELNFS
jgi:hypothetical protein